MSGYGQQGPFRGEPCTDTVMQAFSGLISVNPGNDGAPHRVGFLVVDMVTGLYAYQALATALLARQGATRGRHIDVSLMQSAAAIQAAKIAEYALADGAPRGRATSTPTESPTSSGITAAAAPPASG